MGTSTLLEDISISTLHEDMSTSTLDDDKETEYKINNSACLGGLARQYVRYCQDKGIELTGISIFLIVERHANFIGDAGLQTMNARVNACNQMKLSLWIRSSHV